MERGSIKNEINFSYVQVLVNDLYRKVYHLLLENFIKKLSTSIFLTKRLQVNFKEPVCRKMIRECFNERPMNIRGITFTHIILYLSICRFRMFISFFFDIF